MDIFFPANYTVFWLVSSREIGLQPIGDVLKQGRSRSQYGRIAFDDRRKRDRTTEERSLGFEPALQTLIFQPPIIHSISQQDEYPKIELFKP